MGIRQWLKPCGAFATRRLGRVVVLLGLGILGAGCTDDGLTEPRARPGAPTGPGQASEDPTSAAPFIRRVELDFQAVGSFRPGTPVTVTAIARGRRAARDVDFTVVVLDEEMQAGSTPSVRRAESSRGGVGRGQEQRLSATLSFPQPGLYRVVASTRSEPLADENLAPGDSVVGNFSSETLYVLIEENGGGASREYSVPEGRMPRYGSFGPFTQTAAARASVAATGGPGFQTTGTVTGVMWNYNDLTMTHERLGPTVGTLNCRNSTGTYVASSFNVAADGTFSFSCASGVYYGQIHLRNTYVDAYGLGGAFAGANFDQTMGSNLSIQSSNWYAGYLFLTLTQHVPVANSRFARSRPQITAWVSTTTDARVVYCPVVDTRDNICPRADIIRSHQSRVFDQDGLFVTVHEYGHAFHWRAIEPWPSTYGCDPNGHNPAVPYTRACAFVEGFADFFAGWILANRLNSNYGYSDYNWENTNYGGSNGLITEGAAAGFFYDLVDGAGDWDALGNTTASEESFDNAVYPGSFIANIMANCAPYTQTSTGYTYANPLDGMDQVVYCIEGHINAEVIGPTYGSNWRTQWDGVSWTPTFPYPTGFSGTTVRTLWKWNFYRTTT